jgi:hypothetical protein
LKNLERPQIGHPMQVSAAPTAARPLLRARAMLRSRSSWLRVLRLYDVDDARPLALLLEDVLLDTRVHACSRFQSVDDPGRHAVYSVHDADGATLLPLGPPLDGRPGGREGEHTLVAVREFRRVPLDASSLALTVFTARPGRAVSLVAALAHFVERAVDVYQPAYLLLAHSLEEPRISLLLTAVQDSLALAASHAAAFSLDALQVEVDAMLEDAPERYAYAPDLRPTAVTGAISPYAV